MRDNKIEQLEGALRDAYESGYYKGGADTEEWGKAGSNEDAEEAYKDWREALDKGALQEYGGHGLKCGCWDKMDSGQLFARHDWKCTCGFRAALDKEPI